MPKTKKEIISGMKANKNDAMLQAKIEVTAKEIQKILEENKLGLQPFLDFSPYGILPRVKLVSTENEEDTK